VRLDACNEMDLSSSPVIYMYNDTIKIMNHHISFFVEVVESLLCLALSICSLTDVRDSRKKSYDKNNNLARCRKRLHGHHDEKRMRLVGALQDHNAQD